MDRRMTQRLNLHLPAKYTLRRLGAGSFSGSIVNISRSGLLVEQTEDTQPVALNDEIHVEIDLPVMHRSPQRCLACAGRVIRLELSDSKPRIAIAIETMQFRDVIGAPTIMVDEQAISEFLM